ncbi:succinylglutamate desuccinylase/aspartoacylase family protein [Cytophagaceae bacterium YF14B1]|uniref:Succinylglutamate desuccinylase/aspartoacylase family protein n=1 Tax=Xanthocytophaga flava TaxID=3048013 RepID=A0AAE3QNK5_9BACT|nr:succinylglutamate desuccinylase/aspartoacylase family protein [Xanthocytophaga flavus]MDJ1468620.1 succinylglutamate desuccinylase/aspartoacylase family protein [Xanthocytophaga flavus]MDJ1480340.1 succinylglutamate desuccinylase/aspartoacylase family protein [Xanthocytophaga flavus]
MSDIYIYNTPVPVGKAVSIKIPIARLPSHTLIDLPVYVFRGKTDGPGLLLTAGIHGDEINGIEIVRRLINENYLMPDMGTVIAIPLVNVYGFIFNSRNLPDGKDLNRCFPGSANGSLANRMAHILMTEILPHVHHGVDFHTGGDRIANFPQIRCNLDHAKNKELASAFGAPFIVNTELIDKSFRKEALKTGKSILVFEGGESLRLDEHAIAEGKAGVRRIMHYLKMRDQEEKKQIPITIKSTTWMRTKDSGIFNPFVISGSKVVKNQPLATITDPYGESQVTIKSPYDGYIIGLNNMPVVNSGDALIHVGK